MPRWPKTQDELKHFATILGALHTFMAGHDTAAPLVVVLNDGERMQGDLHGIYTRTSASYPIHHCATVIIKAEGGLREIDFLDIERVDAP